MTIASGRPTRVIAAMKAATGSAIAIAMPIAISGPIRSRERASSASAARGAISSSRAPRTSSEMVDREPDQKPPMQGRRPPKSGQSCLLTSPWTRASRATRGRSSP